MPPPLRLAALLALIAFGGFISVSSAAARSNPAVPSSIVASATVSQPLAALSFDDGPSPYTLQIAQILRRYHARATFFVVGKEIAGNGPALRQVLADGNEIGNHTFTHANLEYFADEPIQAELAATQVAVKSATGFTPTVFRPPYGAVDARIAGVAASLGLRTVTWDVDPRDWALPGIDSISSTVLANVHPGAIVIMHDGGGNRSETVAALPTILEGLQKRGLRTVTVSELLGLPGARLCETKKAVSKFTRAGVRAHPTHAIFNAWADSLCRGTDLGPATSGERISRRNVISQDFARTGHVIAWHKETGEVRIRVVWADAFRVFTARGIQPRWQWAITAAWFKHFFAGHDWGAATGPVVQRGSYRAETFTNGIAVERRGRVRWRKHRH